MGPRRDDGFDEAFNRLFGLTLRTARRVVGDDAAQDVAAEVLAKTLWRWQRLKDIDYLDAWVARCSFNESLDYHRAQRRAAGLHPQVRIEATDDIGDSTDEVAIRLAMCDALAALPRRQREAIALRYLADRRRRAHRSRPSRAPTSSTRASGSTTTTAMVRQHPVGPPGVCKHSPVAVGETYDDPTRTDPAHWTDVTWSTQHWYVDQPAGRGVRVTTDDTGALHFTRSGTTTTLRHGDGSSYLGRLEMPTLLGVDDFTSDGVPDIVVSMGGLDAVRPGLQSRDFVVSGRQRGRTVDPAVVGIPLPVDHRRPLGADYRWFPIGDQNGDGVGNPINFYYGEMYSGRTLTAAHAGGTPTALPKPFAVNAALVEHNIARFILAQFDPGRPPTFVVGSSVLDTRHDYLSLTRQGYHGADERPAAAWVSGRHHYLVMASVSRTPSWERFDISEPCGT